MIKIGEPIALKEKKRTYTFPNTKVELQNVTELIVRESGTHRLKADGKIHVIATGWVHIEIDEEEWTV